MWIIDLMDMSDYKNSNKKGFRYPFVINDIVGQEIWVIPRTFMDKKTDATTVILTTSKTKLCKIERHGREEF